MSHKIEITNITYNRLMNYFPNEKNINYKIKKLFTIAMDKDKTLKPKTDAHLNTGGWDSP